eukprot:225491_1
MTVLVFSLFVPALILIVPFVQEKVPFTFHWDKLQPNEENGADAESDEEEKEEAQEPEEEEKKLDTDDEDKDEVDKKQPVIFKQFQFTGNYQLTLKRKIKTEKKVFEFDKEQFETQRELKERKVDPLEG